jgi:hypothetical protein
MFCWSQNFKSSKATEKSVSRAVSIILFNVNILQTSVAVIMIYYNDLLIYRSFHVYFDQGLLYSPDQEIKAHSGCDRSTGDAYSS